MLAEVHVDVCCQARGQTLDLVQDCLNYVVYNLKLVWTYLDFTFIFRQDLKWPFILKQDELDTSDQSLG